MATASPPDLAKLRIDRDQPPPAVKRAFTRTLWLAAAAIVVVAGLVIWLRDQDLYTPKP